MFANLAVKYVRRRGSLLFAFCILLVSACHLNAQNLKDSSLLIPFCKFSYAIQFPGGDMAKRFGHNSNAGLDFAVKTRNNWIMGANCGFLFGDQIRENGILDSLKTSTGFIISQNGNPAVVRLFERGYSISAYFGRMFNVFAPNKNSGIMLTAGPCYLRHKIRIDDVGKQSPQLFYPYTKGYDRLTAGFGIQEFIGYVYFGNKRIINFFGGLELTQAFTKSQRSYDYDLMGPDTKQRTDLMYTIRVGWILPLYKRTPQEFYYY